MTYAGRQISASGLNTYTFKATESGDVTITFTRAYLVEGNYGYADGLYANGDEVTVQSKTAGLFGTAANGKFRIRLPAGTHSVILTSARFEAIGFDVTVREKDVRVTPETTDLPKLSSRAAMYRLMAAIGCKMAITSCLQAYR